LLRGSLTLRDVFSISLVKTAHLLKQYYKNKSLRDSQINVSMSYQNDPLEIHRKQQLNRMKKVNRKKILL